MSAKIRVYHAVVYERDGEAHSIGQPAVSLGEVSSPGTYFQRGELHTIAPLTAKMIWEYTRFRDFELFELLIPGGGYLNLAVWVDTPVSANDLTPSGSNPRWRTLLDLSCKCPLAFNSDQTILVPTLADEAASLGSGLPKVFTDAAKVTAKPYKLAVYNPSTTDSVELLARHLN